MKFDVVIGNPPYQDEAVGTNKQSQPLYHLFMDESYKIANKVILITPARFLANTGATPSAWNKKMLNDENIKVTFYDPKSSNVFPNTDIKGGVAITYRDALISFGAIDTFIPYEELRAIYQKVKLIGYNGNLGDLVYSPDSYRFTDTLYEENPSLFNRTDASHSKSVSSNVFERFPEVFFEKAPNNGEDYIQIYGRIKGERVYRYIKRKYVQAHENLDKWKVFVPGANGSGAIGEVLSTPVIGSPVIGSPVIGHNQTFLSIGCFDSEYDANSLLKYIKSKFGRVMLGIMKTTQNNQSKITWSKVPLQDFTSTSDIDWRQSVSDVDKQLYKKYGLSQEEIDFIETNVKEME